MHDRQGQKQIARIVGSCVLVGYLEYRTHNTVIVKMTKGG